MSDRDSEPFSNWKINSPSTILSESSYVNSTGLLSLLLEQPSTFLSQCFLTATLWPGTLLPQIFSFLIKYSRSRAYSNAILSEVFFDHANQNAIHLSQDLVLIFFIAFVTGVLPISYNSDVNHKG